MQEALIVLDQVRCAYMPQKPVLDIAHFSVREGELLFILGRSGIGKSTLLELCGLMNLPSAQMEGNITYRHASWGEVALRPLWKQGGGRLSAFRNGFLSFIFQETNFLSQFSAGENMCLPAMIQGRSMDESRQRVLEMMESLHLDPALFDKHPSHLSGGQRQRMAFIRALSTSFQVLMGDEPTGNLDPVSAKLLMELLKQNISGRRHAAGMVVSHDLNLALAFADRIALFSDSQGVPGAGTILPSHVFSRLNSNLWRNDSVEFRTEDLKKLIARAMHPVLEESGLA